MLASPWMSRATLAVLAAAFLLPGHLHAQSDIQAPVSDSQTTPSSSSAQPAPAPRPAYTPKTPPAPRLPLQETGFLNRTLELQGVKYRYQIYLPEDFHLPRPGQKTDLPPIILFLHGRGERGSEGLWQTQVGLAQQIRDHPERWPFIVVMPQCPLRHFWTDPEMLQMAMATLDQEAREFHADPDRTYLMGLSLGGYGAWELARNFPHRWAAIAIAASGIFWSYDPDRWREIATLPAEYAKRLGRTPIWLFHGAEDTTVIPRQSEVMFDALKSEGGHVRLWVYEGLHHDVWTRAYDEPELPRWLLSHHLNAQGLPVHEAPLNPEPQLPPLAERLVVPLHPPAIKLPTSVLDTYVGEYRDTYNILVATIQRQGEQLFVRNAQGDVSEIQAETTYTFFYPNGSSLSRLTFEHDPQGHITALELRDDRHEERWEKRK
jgi:pimeloyl-ACP methyl ester carboxylesterase